MHTNQKGFANIALIVVIVVILAVGGYFIFSKKSPSLPIGTTSKSNTQSNQQTQLTTTTTETVQPSSSAISLNEKIVACYRKKKGCSECQLFNNSVQRVLETWRLYVNVPKDFYPKEIGSYFTTVSGNATAGYISNGGPPGEADELNAIPECWSTYYEFNGNGEVDLRVKSIKRGVPDYFVRFIVNPTR